MPSRTDPGRPDHRQLMLPSTGAIMFSTGFLLVLKDALTLPSQQKLFAPIRPQPQAVGHFAVTYAWLPNSTQEEILHERNQRIKFSGRFEIQR